MTVFTVDPPVTLAPAQNARIALAPHHTPATREERSSRWQS